MVLKCGSIEYKVTGTTDAGAAIVTQSPESLSPPIDTYDLNADPMVINLTGGGSKTFMQNRWTLKIYNDGTEIAASTNTPNPFTFPRVNADTLPFATASDADVAAGDAATLAAANTHADQGDAATLSAANTYADQGDATTLAAANAYTDLKTANIAVYHKVFVEVLSSSNNFSSSQPLPIPGLAATIPADGDYVFTCRVNMKPDDDERQEFYFSVNGTGSAQRLDGSRFNWSNKKNKDSGDQFTYPINGLSAGDVVYALLDSDDEDIDLDERYIFGQSWG